MEISEFSLEWLKVEINTVENWGRKKTYKTKIVAKKTTQSWEQKMLIW